MGWANWVAWFLGGLFVGPFLLRKVGLRTLNAIGVIVGSVFMVWGLVEKNIDRAGVGFIFLAWCVESILRTIPEVESKKP